MKSLNDSNESITVLKQKVWEGDTSAYHKLKILYLDNAQSDFTYWALFMANKHNHIVASVDLFHCLTQEYINGDISRIHEIDPETLQLLKSHLIKAANNGNSEAKQLISKLW